MSGGFSASAIDYDVVIPFKHGLLKAAGPDFTPERVKTFGPRMKSSAIAGRIGWKIMRLFRALKARYNGASYLEWPDELVQRVPSALAEARRRLANEIDQIRLGQFLLFRQGTRLKEYARSEGCAADRRPALLRFSRFERRVGQPGVVPTGRTPPASLRRRVFHRITSALRDNSGATRSMTGRPFAESATAGASIGCELCWPMWT